MRMWECIFVSYNTSQSYPCFDSELLAGVPSALLDQLTVNLITHLIERHASAQKPRHKINSGLIRKMMRKYQNHIEFFTNFCVVCMCAEPASGYACKCLGVHAFLIKSINASISACACKLKRAWVHMRVGVSLRNDSFCPILKVVSILYYPHPSPPPTGYKNLPFWARVCFLYLKIAF